MALETECILRPNLGTSADVADVPSRTSMHTITHTFIVIIYDEENPFQTSPLACPVRSTAGIAVGWIHPAKVSTGRESAVQPFP